VEVTVKKLRRLFTFLIVGVEGVARGVVLSRSTFHLVKKETEDSPRLMLQHYLAVKTDHMCPEKSATIF